MHLPAPRVDSDGQWCASKPGMMYFPSKWGAIGWSFMIYRLQQGRMDLKAFHWVGSEINQWSNSFLLQPWLNQLVGVEHLNFVVRIAPLKNLAKIPQHLSQIPIGSMGVTCTFPKKSPKRWVFCNFHQLTPPNPKLSRVVFPASWKSTRRAPKTTPCGLNSQTLRIQTLP